MGDSQPAELHTTTGQPDPDIVLGLATAGKINIGLARALLVALEIPPEDHQTAVAADLGYLPQEDIVAATSKTCRLEGQAVAGLNIGALHRLHAAAHVAIIRSQQAPPSTGEAPRKEERESKKFSTVLDQTHEGAFRILPMERVAKFRSIYAKVAGDEPLPAARPTPDQISALFAKVASGRAPFVDIAVFGPYGVCITRTWRTQGDVFVGSELVKK